MWRELVGLTFLGLLLGAAMMANVTDGPMRELPRLVGDPRIEIASAVEAGPLIADRLSRPIRPR